MTDANLNHPGRAAYTGPDCGWAGYVHHDQQIEYCWSFQERIKVIIHEKPAHEQVIRLECLTYLGDLLPVEAQAMALVDKTWEQALNRLQTGQDQQQANKAWRQAEETRRRVEQEARPALLAYLIVLTPDAPWDGSRLVFPVIIEGSRV